MHYDSPVACNLRRQPRRFPDVSAGVYFTHAGRFDLTFEVGEGKNEGL